MTLLLSRAVLRSGASVATLRSVLLPDDASLRASAAHRLVWALFADGPDRRRDFLWREASPGAFYLLSARPPVDAHGLFDIAEPKVFAPTLAAGDRLRFMLRANATVSRGNGTDQRGKVEDVVMHALHGLTTVERRVQRLAVVASAGLAWLDKRGSDGGFTIDLPACRVDAHRVLSIPHGRTPVRLGIMDFEGTLRIDDPERFLAAVRAGFGRGKAFGNGLMLIRRE